MDFNLHISLGNAAMNTPTNVAEALERVAAQMQAGSYAGSIMDINGNTVGNFSFEGSTAEFDIIEQAMGLDGESHDLDSALETIWGHGVADENMGGVDEPGGHTFRVGRYIRHTDSDGNKSTTEHDTVDDAEQHMDDLRERYEQDEA